MKLLRILFAAAALCGAMSASAQTKYKNPVYGSDFPDPTVIRAKNGTFYTYATGCKALSSSNLVNWTKQSNAINRPTWNDSTYVNGEGKKVTDYYSLWACDVSYLDGKYYMQYASALWGNGYRTGIGVAVSDGPTGFTDKGKLFRSTEIGVWNSIDPCFYQEKDKKYIIWGSFHDICIAELEDDGLAVKNFKPINNPYDASKQKRFSGATKIAGGAFEGPMIYKRGKYYYLFCSVGSCCEGEKSTYRTVVGRSTSIKGPYVNKQGGDMKNDNYTTIIKGNDRWKGPGHNSEIITDDEGQDWLLYHCYDRNNNFNGRLLLLDRIDWDDQDWPVINDGTPSSDEHDGPVFYTGDGANMTYKMDNADFSMSKFKYWNASSTGDCVMTSSAGTNVFMPFARVTSVNGGGTFDINQQLSGLKPGIYEVRVKTYARGDNADIYVNQAKTRVAATEGIPTSDATTSTRFLAGSYEQSVYGIVTGTKLTIGMASNAPTIEGDRFAVADVRLIFREKNADAAAELTKTFAENIERVKEDNAPAYKEYRNRLQQYIATAQSTDGTNRFNALTKIDLTLDSLASSIELYDSLQRVNDLLKAEIERGKSINFSTEEAAKVYEEAAGVYANGTYTDKDVKALIARMYAAMHNIFYTYQKGDGTAENPYIITTPEQLDYMHDVLVKSKMTYFRLDADIDMKDIVWRQLNSSAATYLYWINFDGNGHLIFNLHNDPADKLYPSFFGTLCGECRNVGFVNADIQGTEASGAGIVAGALGYSSFKDADGNLFPVIIENCYATGNIRAKGYIGTFGGNIASSPITVRNVYSAVNIQGDTNSSTTCAGGLIGRIRTAMTLEHAFATGYVEAYTAGGVVGGGQASTTPASIFSNLLAWGKKVNGTVASAVGGVREADEQEALYFLQGISVNDNPLEDGYTYNQLRSVAGLWGSPWHKDAAIGNGYPILEWQVARGDYKEYCGFEYDPTAIEGIKDTPLQKNAGMFDVMGRRISQPTGRGIFIIDGKKVVK